MNFKHTPFQDCFVLQEIPGVVSDGLCLRATRVPARLADMAGLLSLLWAVTAFMPARVQATEVVEVRVAASSDDAEQGSASTDLGSSDLEMTVEGSVNQTVGLRFNNLTVPTGASIANAYLQFKVDEISSSTTTLTITGEDSDQAATFTAASGNISSRPKTSASVGWIPPAWNTVGQADLPQRTPDIAAVVQEIVDRGGWSSGNSLAVIITGDGTGKRVAESFNGDQSGAPLLHIEYSSNPGAPQVSAGPDHSVTLPVDTVCLTGTASDNGLPNPPGTMTFLWTQKNGPPGVAFSDASTLATTASFPGPGAYTLSLSANDGATSASDDVNVTVGQTIQVPGDAPSIQAAINLANDGDTVLVAAGIYSENVVVSKTITLASHYLTTQDPSFIDQTVIDGNGGVAVVQVSSSVGPNALITGFTIRNGDDGVKIMGKVRLFKNRITANISDAVDYDAGGGEARFNINENNGDDGFDLNRASAVIIEDNIIRNNGGDGLEIRLHAYVGPTLTIAIRNNTIANNDRDGIQLIGQVATLTSREFFIEQNLILNNGQAGLGLLSGGNSSETYEGASLPEPISLTNNTFVGNNHGVTGGDKMTARNNIVASSTNIGVKNVDGKSNVSYTLFWNNGTNFQASNIDAASTLIADPQLDQSYYPQPGSPAINAGVNVGFPFNGAAPDLGAYETPVNQGPTANAGADQTITLPTGTLNLNGIASDDGLPNPPGALNFGWKPISGGCGVSFGDPSARSTTAAFPTPGTYNLRFTVDDGELTASDDVIVTVTSSSPTNLPPAVNAGPDQTVTLSSAATFTGTASDDGLPSGTLSTTWTKEEGTGTVSFSAPSSLTTTATFSTAGSYRLRLTADDGALSTSDDVLVTVTAASTTLTFTAAEDASIKAGSATSNFGAAISLEGDSSPVKHFLVKFLVSGVGGSITSAKLRLYNVNSSNIGGIFHRAVNNNWMEGTVTWNTAPSADPAVLASLGSVTSGNWYEVDITSSLLITGDGTYSIRVDSTSNNGTAYRSKEAVGFSPQLVLTVN